MTAATCAASALSLLLAATATWAQDDIRREPVRFAPGKSAASINGSIKGDQTVDYVLKASAGQQMSVRLKTSNASNYFNVLPPGSQEAVFDGASSGNSWSGALTTDGEYTVRVYLMRNAARRDETAKYTVDIGISGGKADK